MARGYLTIKLFVRHYRMMVTALFSHLLILTVSIYRAAISPLLPPGCRFFPTCSVYALEAIRCHGPWQGGWLGLKRLSRCHPFTAGGYDPVPVPQLNRNLLRSHKE